MYNFWQIFLDYFQISEKVDLSMELKKRRGHPWPLTGRILRSIGSNMSGSGSKNLLNEVTLNGVLPL